MALTLGLLAGLGAGMHATGARSYAAPNADHARCVAQAISPYVGPGFGQIVTYLVSTGEIFTTGTEASTNVCG